jgi:hypothetical protein
MKNPIKLFRGLARHAVAPMVGAGMYGATFLPKVVPLGKLAVLGLSGLALAVFVFVSAFFAAKDAGTADRRIRYALTPALFAAASFAYLLLLQGRAARYALVLAAVVLLAVYFRQLRQALHPFVPVTLAEFAHLCFALHAVTLYFLFAFTFGIGLYLHVPSLILALAAGSAAGLIAHETLASAPISRRERFTYAAAVALVAAELQASLAFLPTSFTVGAAVALILLVLVLQIFRQIGHGAGEPRVRRQFILSSILVTVVLTTARWV